MLQLCRYGAIALLVLGHATAIAARSADATATTIQVQLQMSWLSEAGKRHSQVATVVLAPIDHPGTPYKVQLNTTSAAVLALSPGRYQLTTTAPLVIDGQAYGWSIELALVDRVNHVRLSQENAVRVKVGDTIEPAGIPSAAAPAFVANTEAANETDSRTKIMSLLERWANSIQARDLNTHMSCYAPELARYFQQRNVPRGQVNAEKRKLLQLYTQVKRMQLSDIALTIANGQAVGTALKRWDLTGHDVDSRGVALVNFAFARIDSHWVITSEWEQLTPVPSRRKPAETISAQVP